MINNDICLLMLDTSTSVCSVSLSLGEKIIKSKLFQPQKAQHTVILPPALDEMLQEAKDLGLKPSAVVISSGPGSYTGLRIGSSLAKGLAHGLSIPLIAISTLQMMAYGYMQEHLKAENNDTSIRLIPMIDARRMEVYTALYNHQAEALEEEQALILEAKQLPYPEIENTQIHIFGNGAEKCKGLWAELEAQGKVIIKGDFYPEARYMLDLALKSYKEKDFADLAYWTPNYLKDYVAKVSKNKVLGR